MNNNDAVARYIFHVENVKSLLEKLTEYADDFGGIAPDDINWAHVGTMSEMFDQLRNVCEFVGVSEKVTH